MNPEVERKLQALQNEDAALRAEAAYALGRIGDPAAVPFLVETLDDFDQRVREYAAEAIGRIIARANPELQAALEDADAFAQERSSQSIHAIFPSSTSVLLQALRMANDLVLESVIEALGRMGSAVVSDLLEILQDPDAYVRAAAAEALGRIADPVAIPALVKLLQESNTFTRQCATKALTRYGSPVVPALLEALRDKHSRKGAVEALGNIADASVTPAILQALQSGDWLFQFDCCLALRSIGPSTCPYLREALQDPYEFTRASAAAALGLAGNRSDIPALLDALKDPGRFGHVRSNAAYALGRIADDSAIPALLEILHDRHEIVRAGVVEALGTFRDAAMVPPLIQALGDNSLILRQRVLDVLVVQGSAAIPALERALLDAKEAIRVGAATALLRIHMDIDLPRRILLLPEVTPGEMAAALKALEKAKYPLPAPEVLCRNLMSDPDPTMRQSAENILRILEPAATSPASQRASHIWPWRRK